MPYTICALKLMHIFQLIRITTQSLWTTIDEVNHREPRTEQAHERTLHWNTNQDGVFQTLNTFKV